MKFIVNPKIFDNYPGVRIATTVVRGLNNDHDIPVLNELHIEAGEELRSRTTSEKLSQDPKIASWREAYRLFGAKAKVFPSSIESLCKRVIKGDDVVGINTLVDIYNYISIK